MLTIGSLCTGIGGLDQAVAEHFNASPVWVSDNDPQVSEWLDVRLPGVPNLGDLREVDSSTLTVPDIVTAGWPCQPVSRAGRLRGTKDSRWLFEHIVEFIEHLPDRPRLMVVENVPNLLTHDGGRTALGVVRAIARLGFDLRWGVLRASDAGAPHRRARFFAVAAHTDRVGPRPDRPRRVPRPESPREGQGQGGQRLRPDPRHGDPLDRPRSSWREFAPAIERWERLTGHPSPQPLTNDRLDPRWVEWAMGFEPGLLTEVITHRRHALRILGNSVVPQQGRLALDLIA